jgi:citrate lyase subunit beta/citryl-CoA lyase
VSTSSNALRPHERPDRGWPLRSMLFIPAHKLEWVRKVARFSPDSVILDLEDSVPGPLKAEARAIAREGIAQLRADGIPAFVRINPWHLGGSDDVLAVACKGLHGVLLPKCTSSEIHDLDSKLAYAEGAAGMEYQSVAIMPLPETAQGLFAARDLAAASRRCCGIAGVVSGPVSGDVAGAMGFVPTMEGSEQLYLASKMVLDSRAGEAPYPMASIIGTAIEDHDAVRTLLLRARRLGFSGAILIHPSHIEIAHEAFTPTAAEIDYYAGLIAAMEAAEASGNGAVRYRGIMVDYAMLPLARRVVSEAKRQLNLAGAAGTEPQ